MWISGKEYERITDKLKKLEDRLQAFESDVVQCRNFTVYSKEQKEWVVGYGGGWYSPASQQIAVKDVVSRILDKLGIELIYVAGKPAAVEMQPSQSAASQP
jgi:hypothetical protein